MWTSIGSTKAAVLPDPVLAMPCVTETEPSMNVQETLDLQGHTFMCSGLRH